MKSLKAKLRPHDDARPTPVYVEFDSVVMTAGQAITAAIESGRIPSNAFLAVLPQAIEDRMVWSRICQAEQAVRERRRLEQKLPQLTPAGTNPAGLT